MAITRLGTLSLACLRSAASPGAVSRSPARRRAGLLELATQVLQPLAALRSIWDHDLGPSELLWISAPEQPSDVRAIVSSGTPVAAVTCSDSDRIAAAVVDSQRDLWRCSQTSKLEEWTLAQQTLSCSVGPEVGLEGFIASISAMAFDSQGSLWAADGYSIWGYRADRLVSDGGGDQPDWAMTSLCGGQSLEVPCEPVGLAFDASGYLWVASQRSVIAYSPTTLAALPPMPGHPVPGDLFLEVDPEPRGTPGIRRPRQSLRHRL